MRNEQVLVSTSLFHWLNEQTDLSSYQVVLLDGFVFMLKKIYKHRTIRLVSEKTPHQRFWSSHSRAFGYRKRDKEAVALLYQFYIDVAFTEKLVVQTTGGLALTEEGQRYLHSEREKQLDCLFQHIW